MFGGQSINAFDYAMAEGVRKSFKKTIAAEVKRALDFCDVQPAAEIDFNVCVYSEGDNPAAVENLTAIVGEVKLAQKIYQSACRDVEEETHQAMEALIHNFNTLHCLPYSERIWIFDTAQNKLELLPIGKLAEKFEPRRYKAISLNKDTGKSELKFITAIERKDNHRNLVTLVDNAGRTVTTTDNHKILYQDKAGKILEDIPANVPNVLVSAENEYIDNDGEFKFVERCFSVPILKRVLSNSGEEYVYDLAVEDNENFLTKNGIFVHNSRAGAQVPFSSINYGMDTSAEGRLVIREVLNAIEAGLGNGETPIFPISVFQLKAGVNYNIDDTNYDLFRQACKVSAKRLFPNFVNLDAPYNLQYYKAGDYNSYVATMGCRTRVMSNVNGAEQSGSRGNFSFVTINLPKLAIESKGSVEKFFRLFDKYITISHDYLLFRLKTIEEKHVYNYPFLMGQHVWLGSEDLKETDKIKEVLKHASYSIGFCGLAECLVALIGKHHGQSSVAQELGLKIVGHLRERTDAYTAAEKRNWTTFGTPAESTAGQFQRANRKKYGKIKGVTDRSYMTNSSHVPVYFPICAHEKIQIEAPYHALENAGHIAYIEMDGDPTKNLSAFEAVVRAMHDANMGYFSINHPVDRDPVCGYTGIIANECPHCHRKEIERGSFHIDRLNR